MRWEDERYVRLYTRDTPDDLALSWEATALWHQMLRKFDRAGVVELGRSGVKGLAALVRIPFEVTERAFQDLLDDGRIVLRDTTVVSPNFLEAQEVRQSDRQRQRDSRERKRTETLGNENVNDIAGGLSHAVTSGHTVTSLVTPVTPSLAVPSRTEPSLAVPVSEPAAPARTKEPKGSRRKPETAIPDSWAPHDAHRAKAGELGLDLQREAEKFRNHAAQNDRRCRDWDAAFHNWLLGSNGFSSGKRQPVQPVAQSRLWEVPKEATDE